MISSGSLEFDQLKKHLDASRSVKREVEFAFSALLSAANPSDRGTRFLFGNGAEWILAAASWSAGVLTAPSGHNADGFDLGDLLNKSRSLWSVKASASKSSSSIRLINFMGSGENAEWKEPTVFVSPYYSGAVFIDPNKCPEIKRQVRNATDALTLTGKIVRDFADENPQNRIRFDVAVNQGAANNDPYTFIKSILDPSHFPHLAKPFLASVPSSASNRVDDIQRLVDLRDQGLLNNEQFAKAVDQIVQS